MDEKALIEIAAKVVQDNVVKFANSIVGLGKDIIGKQQIEFRDAFTNYLESAIKKYSKVKTLLYIDKPVHLYNFYVHLNLSFENRIVSTDDILPILESSRYNLITGTGGVGKSTLLKHLFLNTISKTNLIPIFIELRDVNKLNGKFDLVDFIYDTLSSLKFTLEKKYFIYALNTGSFVFFFDAFDEVIDSKRELVQKQIEIMCGKYDNNYYFVSTRPLYEHSYLVSWERFIKYDICKLIKDQALELIQQLKYQEETKQKFMFELDNKLYEQYESFASSPLLLTIMLLTFNQYAEIPNKIHLFYQQAYQTLYDRHDASKGVYKRIIKSNLAFDDFTNVLSAFSGVSYMEKKKSFTDVSLYSYLECAKEIEGIEFNLANLKKDLIESVCILVQDGLEYVFNHGTFQEYFTAVYITKLDDDEQKKIFEYIWQVMPQSMLEDIVINILFECGNRTRLEKNFFIPALRKVRELTTGSSDKEACLKYLKLLFNDLSIDKIIGDTARGFKFALSSNHEIYYSLIDCIYEQYRDIYTDISPYLYKTDSVIELKKLQKKSTKYTGMQGIQISFGDIQADTDLCKEILGHASYYLQRYKFSMEILNIIERKCESKKNLSDRIENIIRKKRKDGV